MKYRNQKTEVGGLKFDSKAEAARWSTLLLLQRAGQISCLARQVPLQLVHGVTLYGEKRKRPAIRIVVDFVYTENGEMIWEDTKGKETPMSRLKRHMAKALCGIDVRVSP